MNRNIEDHYHVFEDEPPLGNGAFAVVFRGASTADRDFVVAIKRFTLQGEMPFIDVEAEAQALISLNHPNIVRIYDVFLSPGRADVVLEYIENGYSLEALQIQRRNATLNEFQIQHIYRQLINALHYAKDRGIVHRDVKQANVLVRSFQTFDVVLADFNFSKYMKNGGMMMRTNLGTQGYKAPEILPNQTYDYKCDIWSLGVMLFMLFAYDHVPYDQEGQMNSIADWEQLFRGLKNLELRFLPENSFLGMTDLAKDALTQMLKVPPRKRATYAKLKEHKWFLLDVRNTDEVNFNQAR